MRQNTICAPAVAAPSDRREVHLLNQTMSRPAELVDLSCWQRSEATSLRSRPCSRGIPDIQPEICCWKGSVVIEMAWLETPEDSIWPVQGDIRDQVA